MEKELQILKKYYGTWKSVADNLGVTYRTICNIRSKSKSPSDALQRLIALSADNVKRKRG